jgi:hypothetical protein
MLGTCSSRIVKEPKEVDCVDLIYVQTMIRKIPEELRLGKVYHGINALGERGKPAQGGKVERMPIYIGTGGWTAGHSVYLEVLE